MTLADEGRLPRPGERIGRYEIDALVGRGGMAAVYAVRLRSVGGFGKMLAMKLLLPHLDSPDALTMFIDEARIAAQIQHPNVAQLFELGEHQGTPFMVMELLKGRSLAQVAKRSGRGGARLSPAFVLRVLADTARGLHAAHEARGEDGQPLAVIHRDVSPQNVHVGYDGLVKVVDFGIARARGRTTKTESGTVKGKLAYLAPEQLDRVHAIDRRIDVWALGVMAWELFVGEPLFRGEDEGTTMFNVLHKEVPLLGQRAPELPPEVHAIVEACLRREPSQRPSTADEVARVLDDAARALGGDEALVRDRMEALFSDERARFELSMVRTPTGLDVSPEPAMQPEVSYAVALIEQAPPPSRARAVAWAAGAALLLVVASGAAFTLGATELAAPSSPDPTSAAEVPAAALPSPERTVRLRLGPGVREVRVDGASHTEREVTLSVPLDRAALALQLVDADGTAHARTIDPGVPEHALALSEPTTRDDATLEHAAPEQAAPEHVAPEHGASDPPAAPRPRPARARARRPASPTPTGPSERAGRALLDNPY